ncbi:MAG: CCA tRNA nucleotidyltransferase [Sphingomonadales bacterium]
MTRPDLVANREWLDRAETRRLMATLDPEGAGDVARFVGGAVRDAVLGRPVRDVDVATVLAPGEVVRKLEAVGIKVAPTGIDHGTVTAVIDHHPFEITTLRHDVETFGRHARVAFTDDWHADAARRDFTMNALYCGLDGRVRDPVGGLVDLAARRVRFIGDAGARIAEDALRILRFFRFHAWYGEGAPDADGLAACADRAADLAKLSRERVRDELLKLVSAPDPGPVVRIMDEAGVLGRVLPEAALFDRFDGLVALERAIGEADPLRRLAALLPDDAAGAGERLRLSKRQQTRLSEMIAPRGDIAPDYAPGHDGAALNRRMRVALYRLGRERVIDHALLNRAASGGLADDPRWTRFVDAARDWDIPAFPLRGRDLIAVGAETGRGLGDMLYALESWWISRDFKPSADELVARARQLLAD